LAAPINKYPLGASRFRGALLEGFDWSPENGLVTTGDGEHLCFLEKIDSGQRGCLWGRLRFRATLTGDALPVIFALAADEEPIADEEPAGEAAALSRRERLEAKRRFFRTAAASKFTGHSDVLLYEQSGRYLWLGVQISGSGAAALSDFAVFSPRDNFFATFPEIYRLNGDFFHRYLAIFSSLYYDLQDTVDSLDRLIDAETAPAAALPVLAGWLGIECDGDAVDEASFRRLLREAFAVVRAKGTRSAVEAILNVFVPEQFYIVEQRAARAKARGADREVCERLYGHSPFDFTVLIRRAADERLHALLKYLIRQFVPLRANANIVFLDDAARLDGYTYCDLNARVTGFHPARLGGAMLDGARWLAADAD
jgi:phage tail-like protein